MPPKDEHKCIIGLDPIKMGRLFETVENIHEDTQEIKVTLQKQNSRIRILENWRYYLMGAMAVVGTLIYFLK